MRGAVLTRRGFLQAGALTTAAVVAAAAVRDWAGAPDYRALAEHDEAEVLSAKELVVLATAAERVITPAPGGPSARQARVARRIDRELVFADDRVRADVRAALVLLEHGPVLDGHFGRFTTLPADAQEAYLAACAGSAWGLRRNAYAGIRFLCMFLYYTDDRTWPALRYSGPMVDRKLPEASNASEALAIPVAKANA